MHTILYILLALLSITGYTYATDELSLSEVDLAMKALITRVRAEQIWPSTPRRTRDRQDSVPQTSSQSPIHPRLDHSTSDTIKQSTNHYIHSVVSAIVPARELQQAETDPVAFARTHWYQSLPVDVKDYLALLGHAEGRVEESQGLEKEKVPNTTRGIRGTTWWWSNR